MVSIQDVARLARVSPGTVSNALNHPDKVKEETLLRVREAVESLHYRPNPSARDIRRNRSGIIGALLPHDFPMVINPVLLGAITAAAKHGWTILVSPPYITGKEEAAALENLLSKPIDALIYMPRNTGVPLPRLEYLHTQPIVGVVRRTMGFDVPSVYVDSELSSYIATRYLLSIGRRSVAFVFGIGSYSSINDVDALDAFAHTDKAGMHLGVDRYLGYRRALKEFDMPFCPQHVFFGDFSFEGGHRIASQVLALGGIDSILAASDPCAYALIKSLTAQGFCVPSDISVIGYGDDEIALLCEPALTTTTRDLKLVGQRSIEMIHEILDNHTACASLAIDPALVIRASTAKRLP